MIRFLIYFFPAMMAAILGSVFFITAVRYSESGASSLKVTGVMATWALVYSVASIIVGQNGNPGNAPKMLIFSGCSISFISIGYILIPGLVAQYFWTAAIGIAFATFFAPFQIFMKSLEYGYEGGLIRSIAFYTFAWSIGMASGPFVCGYIWPNFGWQWCYVLNAMMGVGVTVGIWLLGTYGKHCTKTIPMDIAKLLPKNDYSNMPDLAWLAWLTAGVGCTSIAIVRTLFPIKATGLMLCKTDQGIILAIISFTQAIVGLAFWRSKYWMYKPFPVTMFSLSGLLGLLLFGLGTVSNVFYFAAFFYGIYSGMFYFYLSFHSLAHPIKSSRYVAINEAVVGIASIVGPILGGGLRTKPILILLLYWSPYCCFYLLSFKRELTIN